MTDQCPVPMGMNWEHEGKGAQLGDREMGHGDVRKESSRRCMEENEARVLMHGFSSHVSQAVGREKGVCLGVFVLHEAVGQPGVGRQEGRKKAMSTERGRCGKGGVHLKDPGRLHLLVSAPLL